MVCRGRFRGVPWQVVAQVVPQQCHGMSRKRTIICTSQDQRHAEQCRARPTTSGRKVTRGEAGTLWRKYEKDTAKEWCSLHKKKTFHEDDECYKQGALNPKEGGVFSAVCCPRCSPRSLRRSTRRCPSLSTTTAASVSKKKIHPRRKEERC